jgi:hypothetical protein
MAYNDSRAYIGTGTLAAQSVASTASGAVVVGTTSLTNIPTGEATFLCSIAAMPTSATTVGQVKPYALIAGTTYTGGAFTPAIVSSGTGAFSTFVPSIPIAAGAGITTIGIVATGTASATQTFGAINFAVGVAPQYV